ncbi:hypothetical protein [Marinimicrococcus flavescens]|uniref:Uncharacterized protein n=1 Tax=Marinimicrococcus flavescens TaxID=3031815 RepID=A0AAP3XQL5_9PROT|nr:hypothetical protein [Marinimicrococcus flavescens]
MADRRHDVRARAARVAALLSLAAAGCAARPGADIATGSWPHHAPGTDVMAADAIPRCKARASGPDRAARQTAFERCMRDLGF